MTWPFSVLLIFYSRAILVQKPGNHFDIQRLFVPASGLHAAEGCVAAGLLCAGRREPPARVGQLPPLRPRHPAADLAWPRDQAPDRGVLRRGVPRLPAARGLRYAVLQPTAAATASILRHSRRWTWTWSGWWRRLRCCPCVQRRTRWPTMRSSAPRRTGSGGCGCCHRLSESLRECLWRSRSRCWSYQ